MHIIIISFISCLAGAGTEEGCVIAMFCREEKKMSVYLDEMFCDWSVYLHEMFCDWSVYLCEMFCDWSVYLNEMFCSEAQRLSLIHI